MGNQNLRRQRGSQTTPEELKARTNRDQICLSTSASSKERHEPLELHGHNFNPSTTTSNRTATTLDWTITTPNPPVAASNRTRALNPLQIDELGGVSPFMRRRRASRGRGRAVRENRASKAGLQWYVSHPFFPWQFAPPPTRFGRHSASRDGEASSARHGSSEGRRVGASQHPWAVGRGLEGKSRVLPTVGT